MEINKNKGTLTLTMKEVAKIIQNLRLIDASKKNKLSYATTRLAERIESERKSYDKKVNDLAVDYAGKDDKGDFKTTSDGKGYVISPEKLTEYNNKMDKLAETHTIEIEIYKCKDMEEVNKLPMPVIYALNGILFDFDFSEFESEQEQPIKTKK